VKTAGSGSEEALRRPTCAWGRLGGCPRSYPSESLALARGSNEDQVKACASQYLGKNNGIIEWEFSFSTLKLVRLHCVLGCVLYISRLAC
jgi:hypothetical protein